MKIGTRSTLFDKPEEWQECIDLPNYFVSNYGNVKSVDRKVACKYPFTRIAPGKILHLCNSNGYKMVSCNNKSIYVHILVAKAFIPNPDNKSQVNHKDSIKSNNYFENLEWVTVSENIVHAFDNNLNKYGERVSCAKFTDKQIKEIRDKFDTGNYTKAELSREYKISSAYISQIINKYYRKRG